ncbi:MAG: helix-turn-helix transcriptional regulator [Candidatus Omnitrophica bacterium]|nr:helix-turn-helix transcriptional regulator [Candidatus Omnitrophota bacterium]
MTAPNWYWDLNLSLEAAKAILADDHHPRFVEVAARLLARSRDPKYALTFITPTAFCRRFYAIRREIRRDAWTQDQAAFWQATYQRYRRELQRSGVSLRPRPEPVALDAFSGGLLSQLRACRERARWSQSELARRLGRNQQFVSAVERGLKKPTIGYLRDVAKATGSELEIFIRPAGERAVQAVKTPEEYQAFTKWVDGERRKALEGARAKNPTRGLMEVVAYLPDSVVNARQDVWDKPSDESLKVRQHQLLSAMEQTQIHTFGWPIGIVMDKEEWRPRFYQEGIRAEIDIPDGSQYDYWVLRRDLSFYFLQSLFEDQRAEGKIFFDTRLVRTAETILRIARFYRSPEFGRSDRDRVVIKIRYLGLRGRKLAAANPARYVADRQPCFEDEAETVIQAPLGKLEANLVDLVHAAVGDLLVLFDGFALDKDRVVKDIVERFSKGQI